MSTPRPIPETPSVSSSMGLSPSPSPQGDIFIPRRSRTISQYVKIGHIIDVCFNSNCLHCLRSERAAAGPTFTGVIASFSRDRGHGFITPHEGAGSLFVHISEYEMFTAKTLNSLSRKTVDFERFFRT